MHLEHDEATYVLALVMAGSDGNISADEEAAIDDRMAAADVDIAASRLSELRAYAAGAFHDTEAALRSIATTLGDEPARTKSLLMAIEIIWADHELDPSEMATILEVADAMDLPRGQISGMLDSRA